MANPNPSPSSSRVSREKAAAAVDALLKWTGEQAKHKKAQLLEHDTLIHAVLTMKKIPAKGRTNPYLLPLPHSIHPSDTAICLFVDDRPSSPVTVADVENKIKSEAIPVSDVIGFSSLQTDYIPYEARRKLCGSYDMFFADSRILPLLPRLIGKQFFKKKKHPLPIDLSRKSWKEQMRRACGSALLYLRTGTCCHLNVGRVSMKRDEIVDNVVAAIEGAVARIPKNWANVRSLHVKSEESVALPIYQVLPAIGLKIDTSLNKVEKVNLDSEEGEGGTENGEVVQSTEVEAEKRVKKIGSKKGKIHKVRYMDTNLDNDELISDLHGNDRDESDGEMKKEKKKKKTKVEKDAKVDDDTKLAAEGVKKRKPKSKKLEDKVVEGKKSKKIKMKN